MLWSWRENEVFCLLKCASVEDNHIQKPFFNFLFPWLLFLKDVQPVTPNSSPPPCLALHMICKAARQATLTQRDHYVSLKQVQKLPFSIFQTSQCHIYIFHLKMNNKKTGQPGLSQGCLINSFHWSAWRMTNLPRAWRKTTQLMASRQSQSPWLWIHKEVRQREREKKNWGEEDPCYWIYSKSWISSSSPPWLFSRKCIPGRHEICLSLQETKFLLWHPALSLSGFPI